MTRRGHRGFTLIELTAVAAVLSIIAASALPALERLTATRQAAALAEVRQELRSARAHAMALGDPAGVLVDASANSLALVWLPPGDVPSAMLDPLGSPEEAVDLSAMFPGASIAAATLPDGSAGSGIIWFGNDGSLEQRDADGSYLGQAPYDASITLEGAGVVTVQRRTGLIQ